MAKTQEAKQPAVTVNEIVNKIAKGEISPDDGARLIAQLSGGGKGRSRTIKLNQSGGLFVSDPSMKAYSVSKEKTYQAGLNMPLEAARALFTNDDLLSEIRQFLSKN